MISWLWLLQNVSHNPDLICVGFHSLCSIESHNISLRVQPVSLGIFNCAEGIAASLTMQNMSHTGECNIFWRRSQLFIYIFNSKYFSEKKTRHIWCYFHFLMYPKTKLEIAFYFEATLATPLRVFKGCFLVMIIQLEWSSYDHSKKLPLFLHWIKGKLKFLTPPP